MKKTNAMRILDSKKIKYEIIEYNADLGISGVDVARSLNENPDQVFKTLVTFGKNDNFVFVVPSLNELDLKKAAKVSGEKKIDMLPQRELLPKTGYVHGGCSPIGMKKHFKTFIHESAKDYSYIFVSGGKIGMQVKLNPLELAEITDAKFCDIIKGE